MNKESLALHTGVDIIEIERVARAYRRRPQLFLQRFFTAQEQEQLAARSYGARHLAARFAAKEAVFKLLGCGLGSIAWTDVEIISLPSGQPTVCLRGRAKLRAAKLSLHSIALSLSHSRNYAVAQAVALAMTK
ncbi:MAG TPA: holo-ACP synthase [Oscillospiraceae bacterium]|nr:holo-ACP synthase [Oscillospiraceae bacterium]